MYRAIMILLIVSISGCATIDFTTETSSTETTSTCTMNGQPCDEFGEPTGAKEPVDIHEEGDARDGYDETFTWPVHPNATRAHIKVVVAGPSDSGVITGAYGYTLQGPGTKIHQGCGSGNTQLVVNSNPDTVIDRQLRTGDWSFRLCMEPSLNTYDIRIDVAY